MKRPVLLDLFCGAGGIAKGYHDAGFRVIGVDINPQPNYPYEFIQGDATDKKLVKKLVKKYGVSVVHASPPCQGYTTMNNRNGSDSPLLIEPTREMLKKLRLPYVIENVVGAKWALESPITLTGEMFGLRVYRPRLFESNFPLPKTKRRARQKDPVAVYGKQDGRLLWAREDGTELRVADLSTGSAAMGIDWMTWDELREAIPPAYSMWIGMEILESLSAWEGTG